MPVQYKINVLQALKERGYTSYQLRKQKLLGEATITKLRHDELVSWMNIGTICELLEIQPGDLLEFVPESEAKQEES